MHFNEFDLLLGFKKEFISGKTFVSYFFKFMGNFLFSSN